MEKRLFFISYYRPNTGKERGKGKRHLIYNPSLHNLVPGTRSERGRREKNMECFLPKREKGRRGEGSQPPHPDLFVINESREKKEEGKEISRDRLFLLGM